MTGPRSRWTGIPRYPEHRHHPGKANVVADALSRKSYVNGLTAGELPEELCEQFKELRLEIVPEGFLASLEVQPTLMDNIKEAQKLDKGIEEINSNMSKGKAKQRRRDFTKMSKESYGSRSEFVYHRILNSES
jgi:hypothetical protein